MEARRSRVVQALVGVAGGVGLAPVLGDGPAPALPIDRDRRPSATGFVAQMDQQRVGVVLDAEAMLGVRFLVQAANDRAAGIGAGDERGPAAMAGTRARQSIHPRSVAERGQRRTSI